MFECGTALFIFRHSFVLSSNPTLLACHVAVYYAEVEYHGGVEQLMT